MPRKSTTLDSGISALALKKLSKATAQDFMAAFKQQGITSLEDLAKQTATLARAAGKGGLAMDWEDFPICYRFTMVRPIFDQPALREILGQIGNTLIR